MALDLVGPILGTALACAREALSAPVSRAFIAPGAEVAWDDCCEGQLWARLVEESPAQLVQRNQVAATYVGPCGVLMWSATIAVGVLRCASVVNDAGQAPSAATLTAEALRVLQDRADVAEALQCCLAPQVEKLTMGAWLPSGPEGGCVGGEWTAVVLVANCACPE